MTQLTPHFSLEELTNSQTAARKGFPNVPPADSQERKNLVRVAETMERVRTILDDKPILVSSGYRSPQLNRAIGGSKSSAHMSGLAIDFICPGAGTPLQICKKLEPHMAELGIDQLIHEYKTWVHLGLTGGQPRHMTLTIDNKGYASRLVMLPQALPKALEYPGAIYAVLLIALFASFMLFVISRFDPTGGTLTLSIIVALTFVGVVYVCLFITLPSDEITSAVIGGLTAAFGAVIAYWLGRPRNKE